MVIRATSAGWTQDSGRDELYASISIVGNDPVDAEHLAKAADYDYVVSASLDHAGELVISVKAIKKAEPEPAPAEAQPGAPGA